MDKGYILFWFEKNGDCTTKLIAERSKFESWSMADISRCFPMSEAPKMHKLFTRTGYKSFDEAFNDR